MRTLTDNDLEFARKAFTRQRKSSRKRLDANGKPINFLLTYSEWLDVWLESGRFTERGNRRGQYCMSRYNDVGDYELGNVFIQLHSSNSSEVRLAGRGGRGGYPPKPSKEQHV